MSARRLPDRAGFNVAAEASPVKTRLALPVELVRIRKSGIEFCSASPISLWTELTVGVESPGERAAFTSAGVVVACRGTRRAGYVISLLFTSLTPQSQAVLDSLASR
jgi:hypothetical protein